MSVPKKRRTKSSVKRRQSHDALKKINLSKCPKCKQPVLSHTVCKNCGTYKGRQVLKIVDSKNRKKEKEKEKEKERKKKKKEKK
ncbi:MAG: 50S ribosomal protein L32 [Xanthomonadaceae bacterium]|nr:50S ribosomal protein L32 [Rhodospirillaceae bacterium]NIA17696.1 50S ribosomal protein L32 [Xanthomonadaceae bacterium]